MRVTLNCEWSKKSSRSERNKLKLKLFVIVTDVQVVTATLGYRTGTVYTTERLSKIYIYIYVYIYMKATRRHKMKNGKMYICNMFVSKAELKHKKPNESQQDIVCINFKHTDTLKHKLFLLWMALNLFFMCFCCCCCCCCFSVLSFLSAIFFSFFILKICWTIKCCVCVCDASMHRSEVLCDYCARHSSAQCSVLNV